MNTLEEQGTGREKLGIAIIGSVIGILTGLALIELLRMGNIYAFAAVGAIVLLIAVMDGYRAWVLLMAASTVSALRYDVGPLTIRPEHIVFLAMTAAWLMAFMAGRVRLYKVPMLLPLSLLLGVNFLSSALFSPDKVASYQGAVLLSLYAMMYVVTVVALGEYQDRLKNATTVLLVLASMQAVFAIIALALDYGGLELGLVTRPTSLESTAVRATGGFQEADLLGAFSGAIGLLFLAFLTARERIYEKNWLLFSGFSLVIIAMVLSYTRAAWIGFIVGALFLIFMQKPEGNLFNPKAVALFLALAVFALAVTVVFVDTFAPDLTASINERAGELLNFSGGSGEGRVAVQNVAIERWKSAVLMGHGTLSLPEEEARPSPAGAWLYSSFIQSLHDTGIVGLLLYLWFQIGILVVIVRGYREAPDNASKSMLAGFATATIALIIASQASSFFWLSFPWIFSGLAVAVSQSVIKSNIVQH